jgi:phage-related minor tail protein
MPNVKIDFYSGAGSPDPEEVKQVQAIVDEVLKLEALKDHSVNVVLNALASAYWTGANLAGNAEEAAIFMVQFGGNYLATLAKLRREAAAAATAVAAAPLATATVH